ncbi:MULTISPECIES: peptidyl-prolyl cis-trans isomerase [unclassified Leeuwenhoekiella]|uniref:peptidyl-prolyl cis-trans isomerase n=1 Tax=unclassified Leeuwenhoekiella TaxID=2615029 RepID=UPI000C619942|nr:MULTISPECIES: peptidyl-prolyl cis-trans isomerase [unclassified Leeuwenhoekiella]MAW95132.1 peptidylprolyl isomerase [Leeuwenhoekiella sp.]|tara:strand:- start:948 stop:1814 length:867 start_codon:yes stop_codon:yes gene_type:complete
MRYRFALVILGLFIAGFFNSCEYFKTTKPAGQPVARVGEEYLYQSDIDELIVPGMSTEDSTLVVSSFITRWATQKLLMKGAKLNISVDEQQRLEDLVTQYKSDLYAQAYKDALVARNMDSTVTDTEAIAFYENNTENFKLNENLLKLRYIQLNENDYNIETIKSKFIRFNKDDQRYLDSIAVQFKAHYLNDSTWIRLDKVVTTIPPVNMENSDRLLNKTDFIQLRDSLGLYLIAVKDRLKRNDEAPLEYVKPTVKQILLNRRKLELIKELEKDITKDAIKNKQFEIYN